MRERKEVENRSNVREKKRKKNVKGP